MDDTAASLPVDTRISPNEALIQLIRNIYERDVSKYSARLKISNPFDVDATALMEVKDISRKALIALDSHAQVKFLGIVGFSNGQTQRYDDYDLLLQVSSNSAIPAYLELRWSVFEVGQEIIPIAGEIAFRFATEKAELDEVGVGSAKKKAFVEFSVTSSNQRWARQTFTEIQPFIGPMLYGKALSYLIRLNNEVTYLILSLPIAIPVMFVSSSNILKDPDGKVAWKNERFNEIIAASDAGTKVDGLAKALLREESQPAWKLVLVIMGFVLSILLVTVVLGKILDRLIPGSAIIMGASGKVLSKNRARTRFIWGMVIIPIMIALITGVGIGIYFS